MTLNDSVCVTVVGLYTLSHGVIFTNYSKPYTVRFLCCRLALALSSCLHTDEAIKS